MVALHLIMWCGQTYVQNSSADAHFACMSLPVAAKLRWGIDNKSWALGCYGNNGSIQESANFRLAWVCLQRL